MKSARDNLKFWNLKNKKCPWHTSNFYPNFFDHQLKLPFFTSWEKFIGHSFIQNPKIYFFYTKKGGKNSFFFVNQEKSSLNTYKVHMLSINMISESFFPSLKKKTAFSLVQSIFSKIYILNWCRPGKKYVIFASTWCKNLGLPANSLLVGKIGVRWGPGSDFDWRVFFLRRTVCRT